MNPVKKRNGRVRNPYRSRKSEASFREFIEDDRKYGKKKRFLRQGQ